MTVRRWRFGDPLAPLHDAMARGGVLAVPTESSYGLAVDPRDAAGVAAVYRLKARDAGKPLPVVVAGVDRLPLLGVDPEAPEVRRLAAVWPAALTAVLPRSAGSPALPAAAGGATVAVRVPDHAGLRRLLAELGPLTATSANPSGGTPVTDPAELETLLSGADAVIVDDGVLPGGAPSTLVRFAADGTVEVLRRGRVDPEVLERPP